MLTQKNLGAWDRSLTSGKAKKKEEPEPRIFRGGGRGHKRDRVKGIDPQK